MHCDIKGSKVVVNGGKTICELRPTLDFDRNHAMGGIRMIGWEDEDGYFFPEIGRHIEISINLLKVAISLCEDIDKKKGIDCISEISISDEDTHTKAMCLFREREQLVEMLSLKCLSKDQRKEISKERAAIQTELESMGFDQKKYRQEFAEWGDYMIYCLVNKQSSDASKYTSAL